MDQALIAYFLVGVAAAWVLWTVVLPRGLKDWVRAQLRRSR